jgi:hypothetical protein
MRLFCNNFTRQHAYIAGCLYLVFALLSAGCCLFASVPAQSAGATIVTTLVIASGPFTAGFIHPPAWEIAFRTLPFFATFIVLGLLSQILPLPAGRATRAFYVCTWTLGLFVWFCGSILSLLCAFD